MKQILKNVLYSAAFLLGLCLLLLLLSPIAEPKDNRDEAGMEETDANAILGEPENSIDVLIIGDSETYCAFIPIQLWADYGMTSYVFGTNTQMIFETEYYLNRILEHQSPKVVILETNAIYTDSGYGRVAAARLGQIFPLIRYHDRWKNLHLQDFFSAPHYTHKDDRKGYVFRTKIVPADPEGYMEPGDWLDPIPPKNRLLLPEIQAICRKAGAELILVSSPSTANWNTGRHNSVAALADSLGIPYLDMNTAGIPIDWQQDTQDEGDHLNYFGAAKATAYLGQYLHDGFALPDHRADDAFSDWERIRADFQKQLEENGIS